MIGVSDGWGEMTGGKLVIDFAGSAALRPTGGDTVMGTTSRVPEDGGATCPDDGTGGEALVGITTGSPA